MTFYVHRGFAIDAHQLRGREGWSVRIIGPGIGEARNNDYPTMRDAIDDAKRAIDRKLDAVRRAARCIQCGELLDAEFYCNRHEGPRR